MTIRVLSVLLGLLASTSAASAHALAVLAKTDGAILTISVNYDDDSPAVGADVKLICPDEKTFYLGKTNAEGRWTLVLKALTTSGQYNLIVDAGDGHVVNKTLTINLNDTSFVTGGDDPSRFSLTARLLATLAGFSVIALMAFFWMRRRSRTQDTTTL